MRCVASACPGEDLLLDLLDVVVDPVDDGRVVVDDLVDDRPDDRRRAAPRRSSGCSSSRRRAGASSLASPWRTAITYPVADEEVDLAELDLLLGVVVAGGPQHDEQRVLVVLELRPLVRVRPRPRGQLVQAEHLADALELLVARAPSAPARRTRRRRRRAWPPPRAASGPLVLALPVAVVGAVDDHAVVAALGVEGVELGAQLGDEPQRRARSRSTHLGIAAPEPHPDVERRLERAATASPTDA